MSQTEETIEQQAAYERGRKAGQVDSSLDQHEQRLDKINGSLTRFADEMSGLKLGVQRLGDEARSAASTLIATAKALKDEREATAAALQATTDRSNRKWTPAAQIGTLLGALAAIIGAVVYVYLASRTGAGHP